MEPSHVRPHTDAEMEKVAQQLLRAAFPNINMLDIPVDIDFIAEQQGAVDFIVLLPNLQTGFNVVAVTCSKGDKRCDIILDADTDSYNRGRANFSIAHELGHVVLHNELYSDCNDIEAAAALSDRIRRVYSRLEREANYFAGAILIPSITIYRDTELVYEGIFVEWSQDVDEIVPRLISALARRYLVSAQAMQIRLGQLKILKRARACIKSGLTQIVWH